MRFMVSVLFVLLPALAVHSAEDDLLRQARETWKKGDSARAIELASKAIEQDPKNAAGYSLRGQMHARRGQHAEAIKDFDKCLEMNPNLAEVYDFRGSEKFKLGQIKESLADFDRQIQLQPTAANGHWKRGISLYYAGRYEEGRDQFGAYEKVDTNDVENAVWHFLCNARAAGIDKAREQILKIGKDGRIPMMEVYALFKGELKPADILAAANAGEVPAPVRKGQLFYAHLYLGLYYDITGDKPKAREHLALAAGKYRSGEYMGDVAHIHEQMLKK